MCSSISIIFFSILTLRTARYFMRSFRVATQLRKSSESPVFSGVSPSSSWSWHRWTVTYVSSVFIQMLLLASKNVSGISFSEQTFAQGNEKRTLQVVFPPPIWEAVFDQEDANLVRERRGPGDVRYGSYGSENGVRMNEESSKWACWLSPSPVLSVFCPFPMSMGSSGMEDSGIKKISSWEVEVGKPSIPIVVSSVISESGICTVFGASGEGW